MARINTVPVPTAALTHAAGGPSPTEDYAALKARIAQLEAEKTQLVKSARSTIRLAVSEKKGVSLYGLRRFPITFYAPEWAIILAQADTINAFMETHASELSQGRGQ